jgi:RNA polymerase sigma-70 factor (ECF subfamily)
VKEVVIREESAEEVSDDTILQIKAEKLNKVLSTIDPKDKMILLMKYQDELSIKEIQEVLEIGQSAVKMRIKRAKESAMEVYNKM